MTTSSDHPGSDDLDRDQLSRTEIRRRTSAGIFYIATSGLAGVAIGFVGNLVLARLLTPSDFGIVAVGTTILTFAGALTEGGLGSGLVRQSEPPTLTELRALNGIQLAIALGFCLPAIAIALQFGLVGAVTAVMMVSLPITTLGTPGNVLLVRGLRYERQVIINLGSLTGSLVFSVVAVKMGAGVWGLALGAVVKSVLSTTLMAVVGAGVHLPSLKGWRRLWPVMRFGLAFQSNWVVIVLGDQGLNATIGFVSGVDTLGLWSLAKKTLQVPMLLFNSFGGVVYPAASNLLAHGENPARIALRAVRLSAIAAGIFFVPFAAVSPKLIPLLFGAQWAGAAPVVPLVVLDALIEGPVSAGVVGYLFALGHPKPVLHGSIANALVTIGVAAALLPSLGIRGVGAGVVAGGIAQAIVLDREARRRGRFTPLRLVLGPTMVALISGGVGLGISLSDPHSFSVAVVAGAVSFALEVALLFLVCRDDLREALRLSIGSFRDAAVRLQPRST